MADTWKVHGCGLEHCKCVEIARVYSVGESVPKCWGGMFRKFHYFMLVTGRHVRDR